MILEIQLNGLDRTHLYKALEYRDLYALEHDGMVPEVKLYCESLPEKYAPLLQTHNVEVLRFERSEFLKTALKACPRVLTDFVRTPDAKDEWSRDAADRTRQGRFDFEPFDWSRSSSPGDVEAHLSAEFAKLGISESDLPREYYRSLYFSLAHGYRDKYIEAIEVLYRPKDWNWSYVLGESRGRSIKKPKISIGCHITSKNNFSVWWRGEQWGAERHGDCGWLIPPTDHTYGWGRPQNELLFIRDVEFLDPRPGLKHTLGRDGDWSALDATFIAWIAAAYNEICDIARCFYDVDVVSDIELQLSTTSKNAIGERQFIVGWRVISTEDKRTNTDIAFIDALHGDTGVSVEDFVEAVRVGRDKAPTSQATIPQSVITEIRDRGGQMTIREARRVLDTLMRLNHPLLDALNTESV